MSISRATQLNMKELFEAWTDFAAQDAEVQELLAGKPWLGGTERRLTWRAKPSMDPGS